MCGISGILCSSKSDRSRLQKIAKSTDILATRGPDSRGIFEQDEVALGHRRLSVIDTSSAGGSFINFRNNGIRSFGRWTDIFGGDKRDKMFKMWLTGVTVAYF